MYGMALLCGGRPATRTSRYGSLGSPASPIACALGNMVCRHGISARYYRLPRLASELVLAQADGSFPKLLTRLAKIQLLILDDWGITPLGGQEARNLLEVIDDRAGVRLLMLRLCELKLCRLFEL